MSLVFKTIQTEGIAELSYLLGDDDEGVAAVFDPRPDVEIYVDMAREANVAITHIFETHIHADLVSGSCELCARLESAKIYVSREGGAKYGFGHEDVKDGDEFTFGELLVTARHTPGHTPEHLSYLLAEVDHPETPWGILTGDSLFVSSAGRPDLLGADHAKELAEKQFHTLRDFYLKMPDHVMIYPNHGAGSPCGADIGDRLSSTIGYERKFNKFLQFDDVKNFTNYALTSEPILLVLESENDLEEIARLFIRTGYSKFAGYLVGGMKAWDAAGFSLAEVGQMSVHELNKRARDLQIVDVRSLREWKNGHVPGARHIFLPDLRKRIGELDRSKPTAVYCGSGYRASVATSIMEPAGFEKLWNVPGSWEAWKKAKLPVEGADGQ